jgi:4-coumarate--CoA ligase
MHIGVETVVMPQFEISAFCDIIQKHKITYSYVVPPIVLHLAKSPVVPSYDLSSLRMITSGAAPLTKELIIAVNERLGLPVKGAYGLSETSPVTHMQVGHF